MGNSLRIGLLVVAALVVFTTGVLLTRAGRPYGTALLTIHKLVDLAAVVFLGVIFVGSLRATGAPALEWALLALAVVLALATFATGGVVSASSDASSWVLGIHRIVPWPLLVLIVWLLYAVVRGA